MRGINKVFIAGSLGRDPEVRRTANTVIANLSVATTESWTDKNSGERRENTEWHRIVMFGKLAEIAEQYLTKGSAVMVEGKIQTKKWQDKDGADRYTTEILADSMNMLGGGSGNGEQPRQQQNGRGQSQQQRQQSGGRNDWGNGQQQQRGGNTRHHSAKGQDYGEELEPFDSEVPF